MNLLQLMQSLSWGSPRREEVHSVFILRNGMERPWVPALWITATEWKLEHSVPLWTVISSLYYSIVESCIAFNIFPNIAFWRSLWQQLLFLFGGSVLLCYHRQVQILNNLLTQNLSQFFYGIHIKLDKIRVVAGREKTYNFYTNGWSSGHVADGCTLLFPFQNASSILFCSFYFSNIEMGTY